MERRFHEIIITCIILLIPVLPNSRARRCRHRSGPEDARTVDEAACRHEEDRRKKTIRKLDFDSGGVFISHALMDKSVIDRPASCYIYIL